MPPPRRPGKTLKPKQVATACDAVVKEARPLLAGKPPEVQSAALAELMTTYLLGHRVLGNPDGQTALRKDLFHAWCHLVANLMDHYEDEEQEPTIQ